MATGDEADHLVELFAACDRVLPHLGDDAGALAQVIRETCADVERRLAELGVVADDPMRPLKGA